MKIGGAMRKSYIYFISVIIMLVVMSGCAKDETSGSAPEPEPKEENNTENVTLQTFPFSGLETEGEVNQRAYAVMVNNHAQARPQTGLSKADIVFEMLTEGDITRFLAIYQSDIPEVVGPVRSAREYYFTLAENYDAIYVYHGAADFIDQKIQSRGIENLPGSIYDNDGHLF